MVKVASQSHRLSEEIDPKALPEDIEQCHALILALAGDLEDIRARLDYLTRRLFGRRSEKVGPGEGQLSLFGELEEAPAEATDEPEEDEAPGDEPPLGSRRRRGRKPLPKELPRVRVEHDLSDEDKRCPDCGETRERIGEDTSEQMEYVPASLRVIEHVRLKYACRRCQGNVAQAEKPAQPIEKSSAGPGLLAHVITSKYCDHLPLNRQEQIFWRHGADLSRKTLCDWVLQSADVLWPLVRLMKKEIVSGDIVNADDTIVPTQDPKNKGSTHRSYLWVYVGDDGHPFTVYDFTWTRSSEGPLDFLADFAGYLQADAANVFDPLFGETEDGVEAPSQAGGIVEVGCWAHARRKFYDARASDPVRAHLAMNQIRDLYKIERQAKELGLGAHERRDLRRKEARPILDKLFEWMVETQMAVLPKSPVGQGLSYALSNKTALSRYIDVGELSIDNNVAERALRRVVVGRNNWLFAGSPRGGRAAAIHYSLIESARRHDHDPFAYLRDILTRLPTHPQKALPDLLPDRWDPVV
jgi:transposase